ncbi:pentapeptide repeat-containing protein [Streptomyces niveus]|uniref:pentapeptide repeat-containing protein n=1 Tax=Streptomyces niveus TaxID=193462 RepID=UPI0033FD62A6
MCLAHLPEADRVVYLATLSPGADIDHCGTTFPQGILTQLLNALCDESGCPQIGSACFDGATFTGDIKFDGATFSGPARFRGAMFNGLAGFGDVTFNSGVGFEGATFNSDVVYRSATFTGRAGFDLATFASLAGFDGATFNGPAGFAGAMFNSDAWFSRATFASRAGFERATFTGSVGFDGATFTGSAGFDEATFTGDVVYRSATFTGRAGFDRATFTGLAWFGGATFNSDAWFGKARFHGPAGFDGTTFTRDAVFNEARFEKVSHVGPLLCGGRVVLDGAIFQEPVTVEIAARQVSCARTRWASTATLHLRYADLDLRDAVFEYPVLVAARPDPFHRRSEPPALLPETEVVSERPGVRLLSVGGVDAAQLVLHDIDLSGCRFAGAVHLDQLKVDGWCTFATAPTGWYRRLPWRWSRRNTLSEEHHWRARTAGSSARGWTPPQLDAPELKPAAVAALYRQLRKSLEDGKNEPDAADFYYGECEMRRHDTLRPFGERTLLTVYWALSGYGLRVTRALGWLLAAMAASVLVMVLWGLPANNPKPQTTGQQVGAGQDLTLTTDTPDPRNPTSALTERVTTERFEKGLRVVINSVIFRSSGQDLTTAGTYTEMTSRLAEPVLLGLAVLAVRSRVKR